MTAKMGQKPREYGVTEGQFVDEQQEQMPRGAQSRNATGFAFYGKNVTMSRAWDVSDPKRKRLLTDRANGTGRFGTGSGRRPGEGGYYTSGSGYGPGSGREHDWISAAGEEKGDGEYDHDPGLGSGQYRPDTNNGIGSGSDYKTDYPDPDDGAGTGTGIGTGTGGAYPYQTGYDNVNDNEQTDYNADYKADEVEGGGELGHDYDYNRDGYDYGYNYEADGKENPSSPDGTGPDYAVWENSQTTGPDGTVEEEHLLSLYRDPFALNLVQHNGTTSADTTNTYISHSGILKKTKIPTYNCALPVEMIWEWVTKNPIVTSEKEGLDMTCGTPYSTAAAIRAITASSTKLTSTNVETNTYSSSNSIRTGSKTGLQSGIESQELQ